MKTTIFVLPATLAFGLMSAQFAQASNTTRLPPVTPIDAPPPEGSAAQAAQLQREHQRALAAGDHANDPYNSASADALNQRELARAVAMGNAPVYIDRPMEAQVPTTDATTPDTPPPPDETTAGTVPPIPDATPPGDTDTTSDHDVK